VWGFINFLNGENKWNLFIFLQPVAEFVENANHEK
jgi:hypothetical protein